MRVNELMLGELYAYPSDGYSQTNATPVKLVAIRGGGAIDVLPRGRTQKRYQIATTARTLICDWKVWLQRLAAMEEEAANRRAQSEIWDRRYEEEQADSIALRPDRPLANSYDSGRWARFDLDANDAFAASFLAAVTNNIESVDIDLDAFCRGVFNGLPAAVVRDVCAATIGGSSSFDDAPQLTTPSVAVAYSRTSRLLKALFCSLNDSHSLVIEKCLFDGDAAFVEACSDFVALKGDVLDVPWAPKFGPWTEQANASLGWLRTAIGRTSGEKLHDIDCTSLRRPPGTIADANSIPLWNRWVHESHVCSVCNGPKLVPFVELVAFRAAADCWSARQASIEEWQVSALIRLFSVAMLDRARMVEPDQILLGRVLDALSVDPPAHDGWHAYWSATPQVINGEYAQLNDDQKEAARALAFRRLSIVWQLLPTASRPAAPVDQTDEAALRRWRLQLLDYFPESRSVLEVALFSLPGSFRFW